MRPQLYIIVLFLIVVSVLLYVTGTRSIEGFYVKSTDYRGIPIKFYDEDNREKCIEILDLVPETYLRDLRMIKVMPERDPYVGHYYTNNVLELNGCSIYSVNHELAHHMQNLMGESADIVQHEGNFYEYEREIFEVMWANK